MLPPRTLAAAFLTLTAALVCTAAVIETDCVSDEFLSSSGTPSDDAGEAVSAGERDFSVNLIKSLFKVPTASEGSFLKVLGAKLRAVFRTNFRAYRKVCAYRKSS
jgi:hypothetical protein